MVSYLFLILSLQFNSPVKNRGLTIDSIPVQGKNYTGYIVMLRDTASFHAEPIKITIPEIAKAEECLAKFILGYCRSPQSYYDSMDCKGMDEFNTYIRIYSGFKYKKQGGRFVFIEAYSKDYFNGMIRKGLVWSDSGSDLLMFEINLDTGEVKYLGDGGWG